MSKKAKLRKAKFVAGDIRVGNFIFHKEDGYVKISDVAGMLSHRLSVLTPKGWLIADLMSQNTEAAKKNLEQYAVVMFNVLGCIADNQFLSEINQSALDAVNRHKDLYGVKENISKQEDDQILQEVKETQEAIDQLQDKPQEESEQE